MKVPITIAFLLLSSLYLESCHKCNDAIPLSDVLRSWCPLVNGTIEFKDDSGNIIVFASGNTVGNIDTDNDKYDCKDEETYQTSLTNESLPIEFHSYLGSWGGYLKFYNELWFTTVTVDFNSRGPEISDTDTVREMLESFTVNGHTFNDVLHVNPSFTHSSTGGPPHGNNYEMYWAKNVGLIYFGNPTTNKWWHRF